MGGRGREHVNEQRETKETDAQRLAAAVQAARYRRARVRRKRRTRTDTQSNHHAAEVRETACETAC
jgi:hypothetical protein